MDTALWISVGAIGVLITFSGFFSGSETALTAVSRARMAALVQQGDRRAMLVQALQDKKDRLIGALLLGNNLVNILASALATSVLIKIFGEAGVLYATMAMTLVVLIFAEVLPKTYALHYADRMALAIAPVVRVIVAVFSPVTEAVTWIVRKVLKLFRVDISAVAVGTHIEELRGAIELHQGEDEGQKEGRVQEERAMLRSILDLQDVDVSEIMIHRRNVEVIDADLPVKEIVRQVLESPYTRMPLFKDEPDNIVGVIHAKWLMRELRILDGKTEDLDIMTVASKPWFIPESTTLFDQLQEFRKRREHFALVVDEYGSLMGIVTLEDILEEIVGEIDDEHDVAVAGVRPQADGSFIIDGTVTIRDLNREYEWNLPDEEYSTIAGLVLYEARKIPRVGQNFNFFNFRFEVLRRQRNQLTLVRVIPPECDPKNRGDTEAG